MTFLQGSNAKVGDAFQCFYSTGGPCSVIQGGARWAGYTPYEPALFWVSVIALIAGVIILMAQQSEQSHPTVARPETSDKPRFTSSRHLGHRLSKTYDQAKWNALLKYDADVAAAVEKIRPLGEHWLDEFASSYLALNDKSYLSRIVHKIIEDAGCEAAQSKSAQAQTMPDIGKTLSQQAISVLRRAADKGYEVRFSPNKDAVILKSGGWETSFSSDYEIINFGQALR
jgi:hypothetical protein